MNMVTAGAPPRASDSKAAPAAARELANTAKQTGFSIDIDVGGTFTDGFYTDGTQFHSDKVLTTPHDVSECLSSCIIAGARSFGMETADFLRRTAVVRVSTTIGTNLLVQRKGPKIGLIVTKGHEKDLYGTSQAKIINHYIPATLVEGVAEAVDDSGGVATAPSSDEVLAAVRQLIARGVRMIVVSFRNSWRNDANERAARSIIASRYPVHYLRSVPLQIGTELVHVADDHARTNSAVMNAYIHSEMARALYRAEDDVRSLGFARPLLVVHSSGGCARVAKTMALHTLHSGPAVAARGGAYLAKIFGLKNVITGDMGGTSFDIATILDGEPRFSRNPQIENIPISVPMIEIDTIAAGGGTIARVESDKLVVGPSSAGSVPGPAAYSKGGMEPTVTDANLLLGYIDPAYFLGGRMKLDPVAAKRVIDRQLGRKLSKSTEAIAFAVRDRIDQIMADAIIETLAARKLNAKDFTFFSCGGGGALHACSIAEKAGLGEIYAFPYGSVFSAFGGSTTNVAHNYTQSLSVAADDTARLNDVFGDMQLQAERDISGEGFEIAEMTLRWETDLNNAGTQVWDTKEAALKALAVVKGRVEAIRLSAECAIPHWRPQRAEPSSGQPIEKGRRAVWWSDSAATETPVYDRVALQPGQCIVGPAIVEGPDANYLVSSGWELSVHELGHYVMRRRTK
jgi:N-methylhydantoinase A